MSKWLVPAVFGLVLAAGCASLVGIGQPPGITLAGIDLQDIGLFEQRFALKLRVQNPNAVDLPITGLSFDVDLNGQPFAKGLSDKSVTVPRLGEAIIAVDAVSNLSSVLRQLRELQKGGRDRVDYRISGRLSVGALGGIPFEHKGDVAVPDLGSLPPFKSEPSPGEKLPKPSAPQPGAI